MNPTHALPADEEIPRLVETLLATERRLVELTAGEVDAVVGSSGRPFLLQRAQEQLRHSEATKQAAILNALPAQIALLDAQGLILSVNEAWQRFGRSGGLPNQRQAEGVNYLAICDETRGDGSKDAHQAATGIRAVLTGTAPSYSFEYPCHSPTAPCWFQMVVTPLRDHELHGAVIMHLDITDRRQAEDARWAAKKRLRDLIDGLGESMMVGLMTPDGILVEANVPALAAVGLEAKDVLGKPLVDSPWFTYSPEIQQQLRDAIVRAQRGEATRYDMKFRACDDRIIDVDFALNPVRDEAGKIVFLVPSANNITERKQAERALSESNEKFHQLADNISDAFWIRSPDMSEVQYVSPAFEKIWGRTVASLKANPTEWTQFILAEDRPRVLAAFGALSAGEPSLDIEYRIVRPGGEQRWVHVRGLQVRNAADQLLRHIGIVTDITERKRAESTLRDSQKRLAVATEAAHLGIWEWDVTTNELVWDEQMYVLYGIRPQDFSGAYDTWQNGLHPEDRKRCETEIFAAVENGKGFHIEFRIVRPNGEVREIEAHAAITRAGDGSSVRMVGVNWDITERKRIAGELQKSEQRFKALFDQAAVGVAQHDAVTGRYLQVNRRFCEIVGRSAEQMEQLTIADITHPLDIAYSQEMTQRLLAGTIHEFTMEKRYVQEGRADVWASVTVSAMWAAGERPDYCIVVTQDITGRKQLEDQLRQAHKLEAIGTLAGGIAHDFNNILAAIGGYTELARMKLTDNPGVRENLDAVVRAVKRAADLVRQILTFSREQPLDRRVIQLQPVMAECLQLLRATMPATIELELVVAADVPTVFADETQVHQILMNLGTNARHALKDQPGRIQLKVESCRVDEAHAAIQAKLRPGLYARVSVSDTGKGMDAETQRRIFEPFFTTKGPGEGTGLGLAVVHGIMDSHDGVITVYSQLGEGTVFHLYFPAQAAEVPLTPRAEPAGPHGHGERVLFVDDEELLAKLGEQALRVLGYEVEVTREPAVALALVRANPQSFDLVITDQAMPGMTGLQLAAELRQIRPDLPIILTTGYSLTLTAERVKAARIQQLLLKPTTIQSLGASVHAALSGQPLSTHGSNPPY